MSEPLLLDTCAVIWIANGDTIAPGALESAQQAATEGRLMVSPITAWEIGVLMARGRLRAPIGPQELMDRFLYETGARYSEISPKTLIDSSYLPGNPPNDPADRILIATARQHSYRIMTRDSTILENGDAGHVLTTRC